LPFFVHAVPATPRSVLSQARFPVLSLFMAKDGFLFVRKYPSFREPTLRGEPQLPPHRFLRTAPPPIGARVVFSFPVLHE